MENGSKIYEIYKESMPFNKAAVFSDGTASYRIPPEPMPYESVKIRIRTAHQKISEVLLCAGEKRFSMTVLTSMKRICIWPMNQLHTIL